MLFSTFFALDVICLLLSVSLHDASASTVISPTSRNTHATSKSGRHRRRNGSGEEEKYSSFVPISGVQLAELEQEIDDYNVMAKYDRKLERILLVMPLTDAFEPALGQFGHGHLQTSDRVSLPASVLKEVQRRKLEFPWQFELQRVYRRSKEDYVPVELPMPARIELAGKSEMPQVCRVSCSPLDARAPEQYVFVPDWMMKSLRLKPRDLVKLRYKNMPQSTGCVHLQAHSESAATSHAVLEEELRHYSSLTAGTTISFIFNPEGVELEPELGDKLSGKKAKGSRAKGDNRRKRGVKREVKINVVQCLDSGGKPIESVCIQDADISTDWLLPLDKVRKRKAANPKIDEKADAVE